MRTLLALILLAALPVQGASIGALAPDFSLQSVAGETVSVAFTSAYGCSVKY